MIEHLPKQRLHHIGVSAFVRVGESVAARRGAMVEEITTEIAAAMPLHRYSAMEAFEELSSFDLYAGDGHYIEPSAHEKEIQGKSALAVTSKPLISKPME